MEKRSVNLLEDKGAPPTFWERLYSWVTNTARVIVIVTELLVLGAFGWRFWLDRRVNDLKGDIEGKGEILKSLAGQEAEIRILQDRLATYKGLWAQSSNLSPVIEEVNSYIPSDTEGLSISYIRSPNEGDTFSISGKLERDEVSTLENKLKDSDSFNDVALAAIERQGEGEQIFEFTINARITYSQGRSSLTEE